MIKNNYPEHEKLFSDIDGLSLLNANYDSAISFYLKLYNETKSGGLKEMWGTSIEVLKTKKRISLEIMSRLSADSRARIDRQKTTFAQSGSTYGLANNVAVNLKKIYSSLYKSNKKIDSNPCRDFVL
jgi:hypothetical protein